LLDNESRLIDVLAAETGKPRAEARFEIMVTCDAINYYADRAPKFLAEKKFRPHGPLTATKKLTRVYRSYPVVGVITQTPVVIASGGVDSWKMDIHAILTAFVRGANVTVMAFDLPGTGETAAGLDQYADEVIDGLIDTARHLGDGRVVHFGFSFGGNFAAASGLRGVVDGAIDLGGPVTDNIEHLIFGMRDILGNAFEFTAPPSIDEIATASIPFIRSALLDQDTNSPMLVINGADDVHVPQQDTLVFEGRRDTEVRLIPGTGHCATSKLPEVIPLMTTWLRNLLSAAPPAEA